MNVISIQFGAGIPLAVYTKNDLGEMQKRSLDIPVVSPRVAPSGALLVEY
jgi:hypothetical protein